VSVSVVQDLSFVNVLVGESDFSFNDFSLNPFSRDLDVVVGLQSSFSVVEVVFERLFELDEYADGKLYKPDGSSLVYEG
jgi:hypothetical protein